MSKHRGSKSCPDLCVMKKVRLCCIQKTSDFSTHLLKHLKSHLIGKITIHIAVRKSTSKNLHDEMSCWTFPSHLNVCSTTPNGQNYDTQFCNLHTAHPCCVEHTLTSNGMI